MKKKTVSGVTALTMLVSATLPTHASQIEEVNGMQEAVESEVIIEEVVQPEVVIKPEVVPVEPELEETPEQEEKVETEVEVEEEVEVETAPKQEETLEVAPIATTIEVGNYAQLKNAVAQNDAVINITGNIKLEASEQLEVTGNNVTINGGNYKLDLNETDKDVANKFMVRGENVVINDLTFEGYNTVGIYAYKARALSVNNVI